MLLEQKSIEYIPETERHGKARDLFHVWFGSNMCLTNVMIGAGVYALGLGVGWGIAAVIVGNLIGGVFMATHSAQGPQIGVPQMIQSRAQFGVIGAILPLILALFMYIGFLYYTGLLAGQALHAAIPSIPLQVATCITYLVTWLITVFGYDFIHRVFRLFSAISAIVFAAITGVVLARFHAAHLSPHPFSAPEMVVGISIAATFLLTYAPYVADYSRYLPRETRSSATFWWTYVGAVLSSSWMCILGVLVMAINPNFDSSPTSAFATILGSTFAPVVYIVVICGLCFANILNLYCAYMSTVTTVEPFSRLRFKPRTRAWITGVVVFAALGLALFGRGEMVQILNEFMLILQYVIVPWSAINLSDYYFVRHGEYAIDDIFKLDGQYGRFNGYALVSYVSAVIVQIPFVNLSGLYEGPISRWLGHTDIAWTVGLLVPGTLYYLMMKRKLASRKSMDTLGTLEA
ncbi:purine-cytosine permease family protein [Alicyclobacillus mali (ex Roth et al. 2021)]|uniref:purine-cytosine permease family protein n=1 Tax=Alicyclobacillus mali (ex Roth et al. 2021) TaxID=1123961 RepID=UPI001A8E36A9|nr:cytosine permease [Alicyclobacillus mali (ex Roth et al. 2021)]